MSKLASLVVIFSAALSAVLSLGTTYHPEALGAPALHVLSLGSQVGVDVAQ